MKSEKELNLKVGDKVYHTGDSGFCQGSEETIIRVETRYNEKTGKPYTTYVIGTGQRFNQYGYPMTSPWAYYILKL